MSICEKPRWHKNHQISPPPSSFEKNVPSQVPSQQNGATQSAQASTPVASQTPLTQVRQTTPARSCAVV